MSLSRKLSIFDLDYTLLSVNSSYFYLKKMYSKGDLSLCSLLWAASIKFFVTLIPVRLERLHQLVFDRILKGFSMERLESYADHFIREMISKFLYLPAYQKLTAARDRGDYIMLLSSSPDFIVKRIAACFGIELWEGTVYGLDDRLRLSHIVHIVAGKSKRSSLLKIGKERNIPRERIVAYSDSYDDMPLLMEAGEAVAVNPDRKLKRVARRVGWKII